MIRKIVHSVIICSLFGFFFVGVTLHIAQAKQIISSNAVLLQTNIDTHDFNFSVVSVEEDDTQYKINYSYTTFLIENVSWKEKVKQNSFFVDKSDVGEGDLITYTKDQFIKIAAQEIEYLKKVQAIEQKRVTMKNSSLSSILKSLTNFNTNGIQEEGIVTKNVTPVSQPESAIVTPSKVTDVAVTPVVPTVDASGTQTQTIQVAPHDIQVASSTNVATSTPSILDTHEATSSTVVATSTESATSSVVVPEIATSTNETSTSTNDTVVDTTGAVLGDSIVFSCVSLEKRMLYGNNDTQTGGDVSRLQSFLYQAGYLAQKPTGFFLRKTENAVKSFQKDNRLIVTGIVGNVTRKTIQKVSCIK